MPMTREQFYLYSYRLVGALMNAKIQGKKERTFRELIEDTEIRDTGDRYPARLNFLLNENTKLGTINRIDTPLEPFLKYSISQKGEDYFILLNGFIAYLIRIYKKHKSINELMVEASKLTDHFINFPKIDLERYE
jgi:hypothetical protein